MPPVQFSDDELMQMKNLITDIAIDMKVSEDNPAQIAELFQERIERQFEKLKTAGRTPALWVLHHDMVDQS